MPPMVEKTTLYSGKYVIKRDLHGKTKYSSQKPAHFNLGTSYKVLQSK